MRVQPSGRLRAPEGTVAGSSSADRDGRADTGAPDPGDAAETVVTDLYAVHYTSLVRLAFLLLRDQQAAEDVVQDAFCELHRRWSRLRDPDRALAYLRRAVVNGARSSLRHRTVVARHPPHQPPAGPAADEGALAGERRRAVLGALATLSRRQREVLVLRHYLDLSEEEIARTLGISRGAVKSHASRAAAALRVALEDQR